MANPKFITVKGSLTTDKPYYIGLLRHERTMTEREAIEYAAEETGYKSAAIRATFLALAKVLKSTVEKGNIAYFDDVASIRTLVKGSFASMTGPWVKGVNYLKVAAVEMDPFKSILSGLTPENTTEGASPIINSVYDETTGVYDTIAAGDTVSVAGQDLGPDASEDDEYMAVVASDGAEYKFEIASSDLQVVKGVLPAGVPAGTATLVVYTRSGYGSAYGVKKATRKVTIG